MKKITLLFTLIFGFSAFAQLSQDFEGAFPPTDWTVESTSPVETWQQNTLGIGTGNSAQVLYDFSQDESLISPVFTVPTGNSVLTFDVSLSYYWSIDPNENYDAIVSISSDGGFSWTQVWDETLLGVFNNYQTYSIVVPLTAYSGQTNVKLKFQYFGDDGASLDFDNIIVMPAPASVPNCVSVVSPLDAATNVATGVVTFEWAPSTTGEVATSYDLYSGLTAGNVTNLVGNYSTTTTDITVTGFSTTFYWKVIAKNLAGEAIGCSEWSFTTGANPGYCLNGVLYPTATFTPNCNGLDNAITTAAYAGEYSNVNVVSGTIYTFNSGTTDFITIANEAGDTSILAGATPQTWTSNLDGVVRFYSHIDENCGEEAVARTRSVSCGTFVPLANDNLADAQPITCGNLYSGDTSIATIDEANATQFFGVDLDAPNVWFSYTGTGITETVTLNLCGSSYDTSVLVLTGTSGNLTAIAGNDDDNTCGAGHTLNSRISFTSDGITTYNIVVEGYNPASVGAFTMDVTCASVTPPAVPNQTCALALDVLVDGVDVSSDNSFGDASATQPACDLFGSIQDVWFSFIAPATGTVDCLVTNGTLTSVNLATYSGVCGSLVSVSCTSNQTTATTASLTALNAGETYYVQVWSLPSEQGTFTLRLTDPNLATEAFDTTNFNAYPNPLSTKNGNVLNLSYNKNISKVAVYNLIGQEVATKSINANQSQIDMSNLSSGTYLVKVTADNQVKTIKVIKE